MAGRSLAEVETREIPGFGGFYRAGDDGSIWTCRKRGGGRSDGVSEWREIKGRPHVRSGHLDINIRKPGGRKRLWKVHQLVLWAFVGPAPEKHECRHLNGMPADNRLENLKWGTRRENVHDAIQHGTFVTAKKSRISEEEYAMVELAILENPRMGPGRLCKKLSVPEWLVNYVKYRKMKARVA